MVAVRCERCVQWAVGSVSSFVRDKQCCSVGRETSVDSVCGACSKPCGGYTVSNVQHMQSARAWCEQFEQHVQ